MIVRVTEDTGNINVGIYIIVYLVQSFKYIEVDALGESF